MASARRSLFLLPNSMKQVIVFMGTRPEAIKLAPVIDALQRREDLRTTVVSTGQHREMLDQVVRLFGIRVDEDLDVMEPNQTLSSLTARLLIGIDRLLAQLRPDLAFVQGDTTTALAASLACFYRKVPIAHVEAGLRTGVLQAPFPEEANRKLATTLVDLHFAPTEAARTNLLREGVKEESICVTGNTVIDALMMEVLRQSQPEVQRQVNSDLSALLGQAWRERPMVLLTGHRRENIGQGFDQICEAVRQLARRFPSHSFVFPVHLNPNVKNAVYSHLGGVGNVQLIPPQEYRSFVALMRHSTLILTDSGGIQEEAPSLAKPVLVMRDSTERPEGVDAGTVQLVGADTDRIVAAVSLLLSDSNAYRRMARSKNPYGDGHAASRILARSLQYLQARYCS
jgi:UDP-N-acetylglucosamine 2-epimerase (non-hydrolysing)